MLSPVIKLILLMALFAFQIPVVCAGSIHVVTDASEVGVGEPFEVEIRVEGSAKKDPVFPEVNGLEVVGTSTGTQVSITMGSMQRIATFSYTLVANKAGRYEIPAISLEVDGKKETSEPISISVGGAGGTSAQSQSQAQRQQNPASTNDEESADTDAPIFLTRNIKKSTYYVGEVVPAMVRLWRRIPLRDARRVSLGSYSKSARLLSRENQDSGVAERNGQKYETLDLALALVPLEAGELVWNPFEVMVRVDAPRRAQPKRRRSIFDDFWGDDIFGGLGQRSIERKLQSEVNTIQVQARPPEPKGFSGLVGQFKMEASLDKEQLKSQETATLTLTIKGNGLVDGVKDYELKLDDALRVYPEAATTKQEVVPDVGLDSVRVQKFAIVPSHGGKYAIGPLKITIFNPESGKYEDLETPPLSLDVEAGKDDEVAAVPDQSEQDDVGNDEQSEGFFASWNWASVLSKAQSLLLGMAALVGLLAVVWILFYLRRRHLATKAARRRRALLELKEELRDKRISPAVAIKKYLSVLLDAPVTGLTATEIQDRYLAKGKQQWDSFEVVLVKLKEYEEQNYRASAAQRDWSAEFLAVL